MKASKKILDILDEDWYLKNENEEFFEDKVTLENAGLQDLHLHRDLNKQRLYHFGVKHLKVIPYINQQLRSIRRSLNDSNANDFEITYDIQLVKNAS